MLADDLCRKSYQEVAPGSPPSPCQLRSLKTGLPYRLWWRGRARMVKDNSTGGRNSSLTNVT